MNDLVHVQQPHNGDNPFGVAVQSHDTAASAVAEYQRALVESRAVIAIKRPRDMDVVRSKILRECQRPGFAAVARYVKPIGPDRKKWPSGPSVRFAEAAIRCMGNLQIETVVKFDSPQQRVVSVSVTDLESNVPYSIDVPVTKTIERRKKKDGDIVLGTRTNSYGEMLFIIQGTDDDILNKQAALVSKAMRTIALRLLPGDILDDAMAQVAITQSNEDAVDPGAARARLFDAFGTVGVTPDQIKAYLGGDASANLSPKDLTELRSIFAALKDGETTWREVMEAREAATDAAPKHEAGTQAERAASSPKIRTADAVAQRRARRKEEEAQQAAGPAADASTDTPEASPNAAHAGIATFEQFADLIRRAPDADAAAVVLDQSRGSLSEDEQRSLGEVFSATWQQ